MTVCKYGVVPVWILQILCTLQSFFSFSLPWKEFIRHAETAGPMPIGLIRMSVELVAPLYGVQEYAVHRYAIQSTQYRTVWSGLVRRWIDSGHDCDWDSIHIPASKRHSTLGSCVASHSICRTRQFFWSHVFCLPACLPVPRLPLCIEYACVSVCPVTRSDCLYGVSSE